MKPIAYRNRIAFTLVELLVALTIASVVTLISLPAIRNILKQHVSARSAEMVHQVFVNARAQAIRSNQPFGVALQRNGDTGENADFCRKLSFVSAPPPYRGDISTARAVKLPQPGTDPASVLRLGFPQLDYARLYFEVDTFLNGDVKAKRRVTMRPGATLFLGEAVGPFEILNVGLGNFPLTDSGTPVTGTIISVRSLWPSSPQTAAATQSLRFNDYARYPLDLRGLPIESFLPGVELPRESAIDLSISGIGLGGVQFNSQAIRCNTSTDADMPASDAGFDRVVVMFGPSGDVQQVYLEAWNTATSTYDVQSQFVSGTLYFAIGRSDGILAPETAVTFDTADQWRGTLPNYASTETVWLSLRSSSGAVTLSPQSAAMEPATAFYAANSITAPSLGTTCANRSEQINVLSLRAAFARQLAKQGALVQ
ncbi:MAG: prepilin-type N-terminal cleavage/methylation domain-containing protein [Pirellulales bacterium]|nr:prepilin-type N-terminal cleavage/methylation domain-containing protein [Pirellulales bacterium]